MPLLNYILDGKTPVPEPDLLTWARWFETADRRVARTDLPHGGVVSTVFLAIDHGFGDGPPVLFETMSFIGDDSEDYFGRYSTWDEAEAGHAEIVKQALTDIEHASAGLAQALVPGGEVEPK